MNFVERVQVETLSQLSRNPHKLVHRGALASLFSVAPQLIDVALKRCALIERHKMEGVIAYGLK